MLVCLGSPHDLMGMQVIFLKAVASSPLSARLQAASLDDPAAVSPTMHIYCASAQPWGQPLDDLPHFAKMPG